MIQPMIRPMPGPGCSVAVWPHQTASNPIALATALLARAIQAIAHRRVSSASIENPDTENQCQPTEHPADHPGRGRLVVTHQDADTAGGTGGG